MHDNELENLVKEIPLIRKPFNCDQCDANFDRKFNLDRHQNSVHGNGAEVSCPYCLKTLSNKNNLKVHIKRYHSMSKII